MEGAQREWERFCRTGLVQDYLAYCQARRGEDGGLGQKGSEELDHEDHNRWNRYPGPKFSG